MDFANKVVLITGASSGIGAACADKFSALSAKLILVGRNQANLNKVAEKCERISGIKPLTIKADVSIDADLEKIVEETVDLYGKIDVLINNAGTATVGSLSSGIANYDHTMATNLRAPYLLTSLAIPHLLKTKGNIVNISSTLSVKPNTLLTPYCLSKAALDMFTKCLALEYGPKGLRVNSVNPGPVRTEIFKRAGLSDEDNEKLFAVMEATLPLGKVAGSEDVADLVTYLASDRATCITGACYTTDCGLLLGEIKV